MVEVKGEVMEKIFNRYEKIDGRKILEALKKFEFNHEAKTFEKACLERAVEYLKCKNDEMTDEEFLALLIRLTIMYFVEVKHRSEMWYLILAGLLPETIQKAKMHEVVKRFEEQFIEYMEMIAKMRGDEGIRDAVLIFLFDENADFTLTFFEATKALTDYINKVLN
jgi:hypothetical protein